MFEIEKNIPIPLHGKIKYPFRKLEVGDSFAAPANLHAAIGRSASLCAKRHGLKFTVRKIDETTVRCWRVA